MSKSSCIVLFWQPETASITRKHGLNRYNLCCILHTFDQAKQGIACMPSNCIRVVLVYVIMKHQKEPGLELQASYGGFQVMMTKLDYEFSVHNRKVYKIAAQLLYK